MEEIEKVRIWDKKADELTTGDNLKIAVGVGVVFTLAPIAVAGVLVGISSLWERHQAKKLEKASKTNDEE